MTTPEYDTDNDEMIRDNLNLPDINIPFFTWGENFHTFIPYNITQENRFVRTSPGLKEFLNY